jgi:hypothetical protein
MVLFVTPRRCQAADQWPKTIFAAGNVVIKIYQPKILNYTDSTVESTFVIAVTDLEDDDPIFGVAWVKAFVRTDTAAGVARIRRVHVYDLKLSGDTDPVDIRDVATSINRNMRLVVLSYPLDSMRASFAAQQEDIGYVAADTGKKTPVIFYRTRPAVLVLIDGVPRLQRNARWGLDAVENSAFVIVKGKDGRSYL